MDPTKNHGAGFQKPTRMSVLNNINKIAIFSVIFIVIVGVIVYVYSVIGLPTMSLPDELVNKQNKYFDIYVYYNKNLEIPPLGSVTTKVLVYLLDKNDTNYTKSIRPSVHLIDNSTSNSTIFQRTDLSRGELEHDKTNRQFETTLKVQHNMRVQITQENLKLMLEYSTTNKTAQNNTIENIANLSYTIRMQDFNTLVYLGIIILGVLVSFFTSQYWGLLNQTLDIRVANPSQEGKPNINKTIIILWVVFSVIIAALTFNQFHQQINTTTDLVTNFVLAFLFGFGAEKVLSQTVGVISGSQRVQGNKQPQESK